MARRRALPFVVCTHPFGADAWRPRARHRGVLLSRRRAALSARTCENRLAVSQLLAGDRSIPGRSPGAARRCGCASPAPAGAAPSRGRDFPGAVPPEEMSRQPCGLSLQFVPPHNASRSALSGRGGGDYNPRAAMSRPLRPISRLYRRQRYSPAARPPPSGNATLQYLFYISILRLHIALRRATFRIRP